MASGHKKHKIGGSSNHEVLRANGSSSGDLARLQRERDEALESLSELHAQLRGSEELLIGLLGSSLDGICLLDDRKVYYVNPRLCEMLGCEAEELVGNDFTQYIADEALVRTQQMYRRMMRSEEFPQRYETVLQVAGRDRIEVGIHADLITFHGRDSLILRIRDISAHRQARKMAVENERLEAVLTVAHSVGSNFSNALSIIRSQASSIVESFLPNTRPYESALQVLEAAEHAAELTKRLLSVVRMSGSDASVHIEPVLLKASLEKARSLLESGLDERNVRIGIEQDACPWYVMADAGQLLDVLMNIFLNAADAMSRGGTIEVGVSNQVDEVDQDALDDAKKSGFVCVTVRDSGEGMTADQITKVFEPFYTTRKSKNAFGLGLPVAQQMLKRWGGEIEISSVPGEGTSVMLYLPQAADAELEKMGADDGRYGRMLLVVEDDFVQRSTMVGALLAAGFKVLEADHGEQAIALYKEHGSQIALTILDWIIPGSDGAVVLQSIQNFDPDARVILISGFSKDYVRSQIKRGAWAFIQKPFAGDELLAAVHRTLPAPRCVLPAGHLEMQTKNATD